MTSQLMFVMLTLMDKLMIVKSLTVPSLPKMNGEILTVHLLNMSIVLVHGMYHQPLTVLPLGTVMSLLIELYLTQLNTMSIKITKLTQPILNMTNMKNSQENVTETKTDLLMLVNSTIVSLKLKTKTELLSVKKMLCYGVNVPLFGKIHLSLVMPPGNVVILCIFLEKLPIIMILTVMVNSILQMMLIQNIQNSYYKNVISMVMDLSKCVNSMLVLSLLKMLGEKNIVQLKNQSLVVVHSVPLKVVLTSLVMSLGIVIPFKKFPKTSSVNSILMET